jgi:hypothetical protein
MRIEEHNTDGTGYKDHEVYDLEIKSELDFWESVTGVPCPVEGCTHTVLWFEAGFVPGYRVCMAQVEPGAFDLGSIRHRFIAKGTAANPKLIRLD